MAATTTTNYADALNVLYSREEVERATYEVNPGLALMPKKTDFKGKSFAFDVKYGNAQSRSAAFATAYGQRGAYSALKQFNLTRKKDYAVISLQNELIEASEGDDAAMLDALKEEMDGALGAMRESMGRTIWGDGSGKLGRIATGGISSAVITLESAGDVVKFEPGMVLEVSATASGGSVRSGTVTVLSVQRDAATPTVTCTANVTTGISAAAAGDYIFAAGDYDSLPTGIPGWIPVSAPASTAFFGVDRTADPQRLAGLRFDGTSMDLVEAWKKFAYRLQREGANPNYGFTNPDDLANLDNLLGSKAVYEDFSVGNIGFRAMIITAGNAKMKLISDRNVPAGYGWGLQLDTWCFKTLNAAPRILTRDVVEVSEDAKQIRFGYYGNIMCKAPGKNGVVALPTT